MPVHKKHQHFPLNAFSSFNKLTSFEKLVTIVGSIEPITSIQQVARLYELKSAVELPLFSWAFGMFGTCLWLAYGIKRKSGPLIISSLLWLGIYIPIVIAILLYG